MYIFINLCICVCMYMRGHTHTQYIYMDKTHNGCRGRGGWYGCWCIIWYCVICRGCACGRCICSCWSAMTMDLPAPDFKCPVDTIGKPSTGGASARLPTFCPKGRLALGEGPTRNPKIWW